MNELKLLLLLACLFGIMNLPWWKNKQGISAKHLRGAGYGVLMTSLGALTLLAMPPKGLLIPLLLLVVSVLLFISFSKDVRDGSVGFFLPPYAAISSSFNKGIVGLYKFIFFLLFALQGLLVTTAAINALKITVTL